MADLEEFMHVTGVDADRARFYMESAAWDLQVALSSFYEDDIDNNIVQQELANLPTTTATRTPVVQEMEDPDEGSDVDGQRPPHRALDELNVEEQLSRHLLSSTSSLAASGIKEGAGVSKPAYAKYGSIYGLPQANSSDDDDDEEKGQAFYAGGSERSGQQIIGPGKKSHDVVAGLFKSAKEHGAETVNENDDTSTKKGQSVTFRGTGYVLGSTESDSEVVASNPSTSNAPMLRGAQEVTLKMWRNGFSIDEGPLRDYTDPGNREFLNCIRQGEIPQELIRLARGGEVSLNMEDHRQTDYERPKINLHAFSGAGHLLGSPTPNVTSAVSINSGPIDESVPSVSIDETQPVTNVQIRLNDGTRLMAKMNHSHTVGDLRRYITSMRPQYAGVVFAMMTTFPNKELTDDKITLKDANLLNAVIVQKIQ